MSTNHQGTAFGRVKERVRFHSQGSGDGLEGGIHQFLYGLGLTWFNFQYIVFFWHPEKMVLPCDILTWPACWLIFSKNQTKGSHVGMFVS